MITEFTCGVYTATFNECGSPKWFIKTSNHMIGIVECDGSLIIWVSACPCLSIDDLIEIAVLMNNIKRQYKQLNNE